LTTSFTIPSLLFSFYSVNSVPVVHVSLGQIVKKYLRDWSIRGAKFSHFYACTGCMGSL